MKKIFNFLICSLFFSSLLLLPNISLAQSSSSSKLLDTLSTVAGGGGYETDTGTASTAIVVGTVIKVFLSFLGIVFVVLMIIAGFHWMRAQGNEEEVKKAQETIREAIIGLIVALSSYAIWSFIFDNVINK